MYEGFRIENADDDLRRKLMKTVVLVKQVPATTEVEIDSVTGVMKRGMAKGKLNPFDLFAIESALTARELFGGTVTALSMGPEAAKESLLEAVYMGADDAYLLSGAEFAGSDVLATSKAISEAVTAAGGFDLIICGKQTTDGDTAQVGAELAEWLGIPHVTGVVSIVSLGGNDIVVEIETEELTQTVSLPIPCLLCMDKNINTPRLPSYVRKKGYTGDDVKTLGIFDLQDKNLNNYGMDGSPTRVVRIFEPEAISVSERLEGEPDEVSAKLYEMLKKERMV